MTLAARLEQGHRGLTGMSLAAGIRVDGYVLREQLGAGGQAEVWRAEDPRAPELRWALKLVHVENIAPTKLARLRREAAELARLRHPSVVHCFGLFEDAEHSLLGIVMEFVEGRSLGAVMQDARFDEHLRALVLEHIANALSHIHRQNLVHRDIKLDHVLVSDTFFRTPEDPNTVKLIDFGIVVEATNPHPLTRAGHVVGTPPYLAPEQIDPKHWTGPAQSAACDVFSFGILAWRLLANDPRAHPTGLKFGTELDEYAIAYRRAEDDRWPAYFPNPRWEPFFRKALALHPKDRIPDGKALANALSKLPTLDDPRARANRIITIPGDPPPSISPSLASTSLPSTSLPSASLPSASLPSASLPVPLAPTRSERRPVPRHRLYLVAFAVGLGALLLAILGYFALERPEPDEEPPLPAPTSGRR